MAHLSLDQDIQDEVARLVGAEGHVVTTTRELRLTAAPDYMQLLTAARLQAIMVTHNHKDFVELHGAWLTWSQAWGVCRHHSGIVVVPQRAASQIWTSEVSAARLLVLLAQGLPRPNELYRWRADGWTLQQP